MDVGFGVSGDTQLEIIVSCARAAEAEGYDSFWVNSPRTVDPLPVLASCARETRRIRLCVGVIPLALRPAAEIAEAVEAAGLPPDRFVLGVGSTPPAGLARARDGIGELHARLECPMVLGTIGPKMSRLAGEVADGVLFNWLTPAYAARLAERARSGGDVRLIQYVRGALGAAGRATIVAEGKRYAVQPFYAVAFEQMGVQPVDTAVTGEGREDIQRGISQWNGVLDELVVRAVTPNETLQEYLDLVRAGAPA
jgi:alkanesulfonate monooxygenase SsuD/methylene tetrahydromethanopterin reductase-like flavin-dependent oxidoreductase (luciferase family)